MLSPRIASKVRSVSAMAGPAQAHERRVGEALLDVVEDRSVGRESDLLEDGLGALHPDLLGPRLERPRLAVEEVAGRIGRVGLLEEQVLDVRAGVRRAPRDARVVAEHDRGDARERGARDVVRAGVGDRRAMEPVQVPDRGHRDPEVRVVREERAAGRGQPRRDDPVVRADAVHADHPVAEIEAGDASDRVAEVGDRAPAGRLRFGRLAAGRGWSGVSGAAASAASPGPGTMTGAPSG